MSGSERRLILFLAVGLIVFAATDAFAVSQWSRKYGVNCMTCHSTFPRLNAYGEEFLRNGYQDPDSDQADGGTLGKKQMGDRLSVGRVQNWFH